MRSGTKEEMNCFESGFLQNRKEYKFTTTLLYVRKKSVVKKNAPFPCDALDETEVIVLLNWTHRLIEP